MLALFFILNIINCNSITPLDDPYMSRIVPNNAPNESLFDFPHYISKRKDPVIWNRNYKKPKELNTVDIDRLKFYEENGYLILEDFVSTLEIESYQERLTTLLNDIYNNNNSWPNNYYTVSERTNMSAIRSIYEIHKDVFHDVSVNSKILEIVRKILNSDVYIHQSRINLKSAHFGAGYSWHSDFEAWHIEDGMSVPRAVSVLVLLQDSYEWNGALMVIPGSHKYYVHTVNSDSGDTPNENWKQSLFKLVYGKPNEKQMEFLFDNSIGENNQKIVYCKGKAGTVVLFDANTIHGSHDNMSPRSRNNIFMCYNSVENKLGKPPVGDGRPQYLATSDNNADICI